LSSKAYENTKIIMEHYNSLKKHIEVSDIISNDYDIPNINPYIIIANIEEILLSKQKTLEFLTYVDRCINVVRIKLKDAETYERYEAFEMFYLKKISYMDIQNHFNSGVNTPRRWMREVLEELSVLIFGVDALDFIIK
jgi:hypothetical protein